MHRPLFDYLLPCLPWHPVPFSSLCKNGAVLFCSRKAQELFQELDTGGSPHVPVSLDNHVKTALEIKFFILKSGRSQAGGRD